MAKLAQKEEAIRLRQEQRLSLNEIHQQLGSVSKGSLSAWLRPYPLTPEEQKQKMRKRGSRTQPPEDSTSRFWAMCNVSSLSTNDKGRIAEAAVLFRLSLLKLSVFGSSFDGDNADWIIRRPNGKLAVLQVRWARTQKHGAPVFSLVKSNGRRGRKRYTPRDLDFLIGYDLRSDTAYIWAYSELGTRKRAISASSDAAEAWHKLTT